MRYVSGGRLEFNLCQSHPPIPFSLTAANTASIGRRYSFDSLKNIILDVWLLSETDYLVCTFSSQVCRLAYELMQSRSVSLFFFVFLFLSFLPCLIS